MIPKFRDSLLVPPVPLYALFFSLILPTFYLQISVVAGVLYTIQKEFCPFTRHSVPILNTNHQQLQTLNYQHDENCLGTFGCNHFYIKVSTN